MLSSRNDLVKISYPNTLVDFHTDAYANATTLSRFLGVDVRPAVAATFRPSKRDDAGALANASPAARAAFGLLEGCSRALDAVCSSL